MYLVWKKINKYFKFDCANSLACPIHYDWALIFFWAQTNIGVFNPVQISSTRFSPSYPICHLSGLLQSLACFTKMWYKELTRARVWRNCDQINIGKLYSLIILLQEFNLSVSYCNQWLCISGGPTISNLQHT